MAQDKGDEDDEDDDHAVRPDIVDLALMLMNDFHIGNRSIYRINTSKRPFWVRYEIDGWLRDQTFLSALSWRALMLSVLDERREFRVHEMDEPARLAELFPPSIMRRLDVSAKQHHDVLPVARLFDPKGSAKVIITRSRCRGHAIDALHNLSDGGPVFQPVWISDLMRLAPKIGLKLVRDVAFASSMPISAYLRAAAMFGRIVEEPELSLLLLPGNVSRLELPVPDPTVARWFDRRFAEHPENARLRCRTIYDEYNFGGDVP